MARAKKISIEQATINAQMAFWQYGYHGLSVRKLEEVTSINRFMLQTDFGGKDGLFIEALKSYIQMAQTFSFNDIAKGSSQNIIDLFQQRVLNQQPKETQYGCLAVNTLSEANIENSVIQSLLDDFFKGMQDSFLEALLRDQKNKILKADIDCAQCAEFLVTTALGLNVLIRTKGDNKAGVVTVNAIIQCINSWRV
ncbi:MAG: TetR/AcrR family transcriptional regulator [Saccharospirillaceae bacterium]|nr:hypothetical protein [Pseudomonadales bacterium]NRB79608.1 TetR/AcrR family transcriptional regulator [Saccharospirillaceae bacterium]